MTEESLTRAVYLGRCAIVGNKKGELWLPEDQVGVKSVDELQAAASAFGAERSSPIVGAVYAAHAEVLEGRLKRWSKSRSFKEALQGPAWDALRAIDQDAAARERDQRAEEKAKKDAKAIAPHAVRQLGLIVAKANPYAQEAVLRGLMEEVRREARKLGRERK